MVYELNGKNIRIPEDDIKRLVETMDVDQEEAIEIWLEDEGYLENEEQEELCKLAKENRVTATVHGASAKDPSKKTQRERVVKSNPVKESIISDLANWLGDNAAIQNVVIENKGKIITFVCEGREGSRAGES